MRFEKNIGICILICLFLIVNLSSVYATHWIYGYVDDAYDGEGADGHIIRVFCNPSDRTNNVNDTIGVTGNSGTANYWMVNVDGYCSWEVGDIMYADIFDSGDNYVAVGMVNITTTATTDAMPNMRINSIPLMISAYATNEVTPGGKIEFNINYSDEDNHSAQLFICKDSSCINCTSGTTTNCWCYNSTAGTPLLTCSYTTSNSDSHTNNYWTKVYDERVYSSVIAGNDTSFLVNHAPSISGVSLPSASSTDDDLNCSYTSTSDSDGDSVYVNYNWFENDNSITVLNMPFDTRMPGDSIVYDFSGNSNDGSVVGNTYWTSNGKIGGGYELNAGGDHISISDSEELRGDDENLTINIWIRQKNRNSAEDISSLISKYLWDTNKGGYLLGLGNIEGGLSADGTPCAMIVESMDYGMICDDSAISLNTWYMLTAKIKNGNNISLYVNKNYVGSSTLSSNLDSTGKSLEIGSDGDGTWRYFNGTVDEIKIFNKDISDEQLSSLYTYGLQKLVSEETEEGNNYSCSAVPIDQHGYNGTLQNSGNTYTNYKPIVNNVYVTPYSPFTFDFLRCYFNISDQDNSTGLKANVTWYKNDVSWTTNDEQITGINSNSLSWTTWTGTIKQLSTSKSENWTCSVNPYDDISYGGWTNST